MLRKALVLLLMAVLVAGAVQALGLSNINFGDVEQGETYTQTVLLINSPQDIDNHFVIEVGGTMKAWLTVAPPGFDLAKGSGQPITVTLAVPKDAILGEKTATITAVGDKTIPFAGGTPGGATVGYAVAAKSNVVANVVKPGASAAIVITRVDTPAENRPGDIVKFTVTARNAGNVPATGQFSVAISRGATTITTIPGVPVDFGMNAEQTVKLYWDTQGQPAGVYTAVVSVVPSSSGKDVRIRTSSYPAITLELGGVTGSGLLPPLNLTTVAIIGTCLIAVIGVALFLLKRRK
jgi:hypothetical protein